MKNMFQANPDGAIALVLFIISIFGFVACYESPTSEEKSQQEYRTSNNCSSKASGSSPRCWTEADWTAYCSRVRCN